MRLISLCFAAGCFGGLMNGLAAWLAGLAGVPAMLGVAMTPAWTPEWLYPRIVWGGLWGLLFLLPFPRASRYLRGMLYSLGPTLAMLFLVFPQKLGKGMLGLDLGTLTPLLVVVYNLVWGLATALWLDLTSEEERPRGRRVLRI